MGWTEERVMLLLPPLSLKAVPLAKRNDEIGWRWIVFTRSDEFKDNHDDCDDDDARRNSSNNAMLELLQSITTKCHNKNDRRRPSAANPALDGCVTGGSCFGR
jgi:hypothetical protein